LSRYHEQKLTVEWFRQNFAELICALPRPHAFSGESIRRLKALGSLSSLPDLFVPEWRLFLTVQSRYRKSELSTQEQQFIRLLEQSGYICLVACGHADASAKIAAFLQEQGIVPRESAPRERCEPGEASSPGESAPRERCEPGEASSPGESAPRDQANS
jgi:hypothetical protein